MAKKSDQALQTAVESRILTIRGQKVILDADLAKLYGVATKALKQAVKRNADRFPDDFSFVLTEQEFTHLRSQFVTSSGDSMRSQIVTAYQKRNVRFPPLAFTEHGAIMAASVLNSPKAVQMSVFVVRAFIRMRQELLTRHELEKRLDQIEKILLVHHHDIEDIYRKIRPLLLPPEPPTKEIGGFKVKEKRATYRVPRRSLTKAGAAGSGTGRASYRARKKRGRNA